MKASTSKRRALARMRPFQQMRMSRKERRKWQKRLSDSRIRDNPYLLALYLQRYGWRPMREVW